MSLFDSLHPRDLITAHQLSTLFAEHEAHLTRVLASQPVRGLSNALNRINTLSQKVDNLTGRLDREREREGAAGQAGRAVRAGVGTGWEGGQNRRSEGSGAKRASSGGNGSEQGTSEVEKVAGMVLPELMRLAGQELKEQARKAVDDAFQAKVDQLNKGFGTVQNQSILATEQPAPPRAPKHEPTPPESAPIADLVTQAQLAAALAEIKSTHYDKELLKNSFLQQQALRSELDRHLAKGNLDNFVKAIGAKLGLTANDDSVMVEGSDGWSGGSERSRKRRRSESGESEAEKVAAAVGPYFASAEGKAAVKDYLDERVDRSELSRLREAIVPLKMEVIDINQALISATSASSAAATDAAKALRLVEDSHDRLDQLTHQLEAPPPASLSSSEVCKIVDDALEVYTVRSPLARKLEDVAARANDYEEARFAGEQNLDRQKRRLASLEDEFKAERAKEKVGRDEVSRSMIQTVRTRLDRAEAKVESVTTNLDQLSNKVNRTKVDVDKVDRHLAHAEDVIQGLCDKHTELDASLSAVGKKVDASAVRLDSVADDCHKAELKAGAVRERLDKAEAGLKAGEAARKALSTTVEDLAAGQAELFGAKDAQQDKLEDVVTQQDKLKADSTALKTMITHDLKQVADCAIEAKQGASWEAIRPSAMRDMEAASKKQAKDVGAAVEGAKMERMMMEGKVDQVKGECAAVLNSVAQSVTAQCTAKTERCERQGQQVLQVMHQLGGQLQLIHPQLVAILGAAGHGVAQPQLPMIQVPSAPAMRPADPFPLVASPLSYRLAFGQPGQRSAPQGPHAQAGAFHTPPTSPENSSRASSIAAGVAARAQPVPFSCSPELRVFDPVGAGASGQRVAGGELGQGQGQGQGQAAERGVEQT